MRNDFDIIAFVITIGLVYRLLKIQIATLKTINDLEEVIDDRINNVERQLGSYVANHSDYENKVDYLLKYSNLKDDKDFNR